MMRCHVRKSRLIYFLHGHDSDKECEEDFEREIDAQADAVFNLVKEMDNMADADGISTDTDITDNALFMKTMECLNERMKKRRPRNRVRLPVFLLILALSVLLVRYSNPAMWFKD